jgi:hypothetical protein
MSFFMGAQGYSLEVPRSKARATKTRKSSAKAAPSFATIDR